MGQLQRSGFTSQTSGAFPSLKKEENLDGASLNSILNAKPSAVNEFLIILI